MDIRLQQADDGTWSIYRADTLVHEGLVHEAALATISDELLAEVVDAAQAGLTDADAGLLEETWTAPALCFTAETGPHRTFENVTWSALDPATQFMALYLSTTQEGGGHLGARLAGYFTGIDTSGPIPTAQGRFFDCDAGEELRDYLLGGRRFGVSVDPTEQVTYEVECLEMDPDGMYCVEDRVSFITYQIGGATATPQPGFVDAYLTLATPEDDPMPDPDEGLEGDDDEGGMGLASAPPPVAAQVGAEPCCDACAARAAAPSGNLADRRSVTAAAGNRIPVDPPADWFDDPGFGEFTALQISDDGRVFGHLCGWTDCHTDSAYYGVACLNPPRSRTGYAYFRTGAVLCDDGTEIATGRLTLGGGHAAHSLSYRGTAEHYDNAGAAVADVACGEDQWGIWLAGALRPDVTPEQIRAARGSSPSGDWRPIGAGLEMVAALCVNAPGYAVPRALVASGGRVLALTAAGARPAPVTASGGATARLEAEVADLRRHVTGPMRDTLRGVGVDRLRERLRHAPSPR